MSTVLAMQTTVRVTVNVALTKKYPIAAETERGGGVCRHRQWPGLASLQKGAGGGSRCLVFTSDLEYTCICDVFTGDTHEMYLS